jgi:hypothetical protein
MFQLTAEEARALRSQFATLKTGRGRHRKYAPLAFTEHGAVMLASVLNSPQAVEASIFVVRAFVRLREMASTHKALAAKISQLERQVGEHDQSIRSLITTIRELIKPSTPKKTPIGFRRQ